MKTKEEKGQEDNRFRSLHPRYRWLDQLRGITVLFLLVAFLTWTFSANLFLVNLLDYPPPIGPTWMNHGILYSNLNVSIITVVDMGSSLFMNVMGISAAIAFNSKIVKKGLGYTWITTFTRFFALLWVNIISRGFFTVLAAFENFPEFVKDNKLGVILIGVWIGITITLIIFHFLFLKKSKIRVYVMLIWTIISVILCYPLIEDNVWTVFFGNTLAYIAWGTLFAGLAMTIFRNPDHRIWCVLGLFTVHFVLWERAKYLNITPTNWFFEVLPGTSFDVIGIPFNVINMAAIAISATCVSDWLLKKYESPIEGAKKRIIPFWIIIFCLHFIVDFFQPGKHMGINTSLATISIFFGTLFLLIFYAWDKYYDAKLPFLTPLGRNALLMFALQGIYISIYDFIWGSAYSFRSQFPGLLGDFYGMLIFVLPIALLILIGWILDKLKVYIKF
ncbi:MAG: hypothetical protein ACTSRD_09835 [Promethearchaeota archaeon]